MFLGRRVSRNPPGFPSPILIPPATGLKKEENYLRAGHFFSGCPYQISKKASKQIGTNVPMFLSVSSRIPVGIGDHMNCYRYTITYRVIND